ncbi:MAG TPA: phage holin family protein [Blastocatellia bacterium]|nr:phage holin family protein [Blastocatellia bacterium]
MRPQQKMEMQPQAVLHRESLGELVGELASQSAGLVRDELALARQELREKVRSVEAALIVLAAGAVLGLMAALSLCAAAIIALAEYVRPWQSALIIGVILGIAAGVSLAIGIGRFRQTSLKPEQTIETLEENKEWLKEIT